ncbi:dethiobiotin synthase [Altericista sp. CCNU0014]|uniref:dethiobiotin synthase n=1 Tax=Altericista sp. CCNU0014 TaxID=3082949 RepID=UPI00384F449E
MATSLFVSGTDTGVGKTAVTAALTAYLKSFYPQQKVAVFKPIQSGEGDREFYARQFDLSQTLEQITPLYFEAPLAPPLAAAAEGKSVDLGLAWRTFQTLQQTHDWILVEGVGGLGSPITAELTVADLARDWTLPTVLVVPVRLGAIGQAIAQVALAQQARVDIRGLILSCSNPCSALEIEQWASVELLESFTRHPVLGILPHQDDLALTALARAAAEWDIEALLPRLHALRMG